MTWWLIIHTPTGVYTWPVWGEADPPDEDLINRARVAAGFPDHDRWATDGSDWDVQATLGEPHPKLLERAKVGTIDDLRKVDAAAVGAHVKGRKASGRRARMDHIRVMLAELDADELAQVMAERKGS